LSIITCISNLSLSKIKDNKIIYIINIKAISFRKVSLQERRQCEVHLLILSPRYALFPVVLVRMIIIDTINFVIFTHYAITQQSYGSTYEFNGKLNKRYVNDICRNSWNFIFESGFIGNDECIKHINYTYIYTLL